MYAAGLMMFVLSAPATLGAGIATAVPEIGGGSLVTGLGLLSGTLLILRARWGAK
jgi:hypothetical protein